MHVWLISLFYLCSVFSHVLNTIQYCWFVDHFFEQQDQNDSLIIFFFSSLATCPTDSSSVPEPVKHFTQPAPETGEKKLHVHVHVNLQCYNG